MNDELIARLEAAPHGSRELSDEALLAVGFALDGGPLRVWRAPDGTKFLGSDRPSPTESIDDALKWMVPEGWWWHVGHLRAEVLPTTPLNGAPVNNARFYEPDGRPVRFDSMCAHDRKRLPVALTCAGLKARQALAFPDPIPRSIYGSAIGLLRKANPKAKWRLLKYQHKAHWIAAALKALEAG